MRCLEKVRWLYIGGLGNEGDLCSLEDREPMPVD